MRKITFGLAAFATMAFAMGASASPIPTPYWEMDYDISDSIFWVDAPVIGVSTVTMGTGTMQIHRSSVDQDPGASGLQGFARLAAFNFDVMYNLQNVVTDMQLTMHGDANGAFNSAVQTVTWDADPATGYADTFQSIGTVTCIAGALVCGYAGLPDGTPVKVDSTIDQPLSALLFSGVQAAMVMPTLPDPPSEYRIQGIRQTKVCIGGDTGTGTQCLELPEPNAGILVGLGVLGVALARYRRR